MSGSVRVSAGYAGAIVEWFTAHVVPFDDVNGGLFVPTLLSVW